MNTHAAPALAPRESQMQAFLSTCGWSFAEAHPLKGDASFRRYLRLTRGAERAMLMDAPPEKEPVAPYLAVARHLQRLGYSAPRILAEDAPHGFLLLEDLGDDLFTPLLAHGAHTEAQLYTAAVDTLVAWHRDAGMRKGAALAIADYDLKEMLREVALFADWFLPEALGPAQAEALRAEFMRLWEAALMRHLPPCEQFVHRDYHADNLLFLPLRAGVAQVGLLDFQDALWGHAAYDLASLLEDARRDVSPDIAAYCLERYIGATGVERREFLQHYALLAAQRNTKIIGIFARLARRDGKPGYLRFLPRVWAQLERDLQHPQFAALQAWLARHMPRQARGALHG